MASLAVVYLGEPRNARTAAQQHQHLFDQLPVSEILDWTWPNRASHQDLDCSERTQIRDFFDALPRIHGSHFLKLRRDVWISDEAMPHLVQGIRSMLSQDIDWFFAGMDYQGPNAPAQTLERMKTAGAEWVADLVVAGDINRIRPVPALSLGGALALQSWLVVAADPAQSMPRISRQSDTGSTGSYLGH